MTDVFLERTFDPPLRADDALELARLAGGCFDLHRVRWHGSCLGTDGGRMLCWFSAPDAEATRTALRQLGADARVLWPGTVHEAPAPAEPNVLVERRFDAPVALAQIQAVENENAWCLEAHHVTFARTFFSRDCKRMVCLYQAPDAESVRLAQRQAGMPLERVWAFQRVGPA